MKKLSLLCALIIATLTIQAQTINDIPLKDIDVEYIDIEGYSEYSSVTDRFSRILEFKIDFGQKRIADELRFKDVNGNTIEPSSMMDALNFMSLGGYYELVNAYGVATEESREYHFILKRKDRKN